jgi:Holliday junction resolvase RusA-like endonuclease
MMVNLFIPGLPVAQGRPRFTAFHVGPHARVKVYDPKRSAEWKAHVQAQVRLAKLIPDVVNGDAMSLDLRFVLPRPKNLPKRVVHHLKKPDLDNLVKAVKDALTGLLYARDSQVVTLTATKKYGAKTGVRIRVKEMA